MKYDPEKHHRQSIRLKNYDYSSAGAYFITICAYNKEYLFGEISDGKTTLNEFGQIARDEWLKTVDIRKEIQLDKYIMMPNHIHGIVIITGNDVPVGANGRSPLQIKSKSISISSFIAGYKSTVTKQINIIRKKPGLSVWQRNYYEHIIRSDKSLERIREYIVNNPLKWELDEYNPLGAVHEPPLF